MAIRMTAYAVTVKTPKNPDHNPREKVTGECPATGLHCTDVTGEHHTFINRAPASWTVDEVRAWALTKHGMPVTRVEAVEL